MEITKKEYIDEELNIDNPDEMGFSMDMDFDNVFSDAPEVKEIDGTSSSDGLGTND